MKPSGSSANFADVGFVDAQQAVDGDQVEFTPFGASAVRRGSIVVHHTSGMSFVVDAVLEKGMIVVRTLDVTNESEWNISFSMASIGDVIKNVGSGEIYLVADVLNDHACLRLVQVTTVPYDAGWLLRCRLNDPVPALSNLIEAISLLKLPEGDSSVNYDYRQGFNSAMRVVEDMLKGSARKSKHGEPSGTPDSE